MDAKSLEALHQLKRAMDETSPEEIAERPRPNIPSCGFSEESERIFVELAKKRIGAPAQSEYLARPALGHEDSVPVMDRVTREIRQEFAALNKLAALQESADQRAREKKESRLTKAARRRERKAEKAAKVAKTAKKAPSTKKAKLPISEVKQSANAKPSTDAPASKWIERTCWRCKSKMVIHADWADPPSLCKDCRQYLNETHIPTTGKDRSTKFAYVRIVRGGAPGLGKRH